MPLKKFTFINNKGTPLSAGLYYNGQTDKGVIFSHGLFSSKDGYKITRMAQDIVSCGYSLLTFNFRFAEIDGENIKNLSLTDEVDDLECAVKEFKKHGINKIHLMGSSMGSAVSVLKAADTPDKFKSLILIATPLDLISIFPGMTKEKAILLDPEKTSSISGIEISNRFFMEISALDMVQAVKKINCPVLLIHGQKDSTVDFKNFNIFTVNLSTDYKSLIIEDGDHNLTRDEDITAISRCITKWLEGFNA